VTNSAQNFGEIEQFVAELWRINWWKFPGLLLNGYHGIWISIIVWLLWTSAKSSKPRLRYSDLRIPSWGPTPP